MRIAVIRLREEGQLINCEVSDDVGVNDRVIIEADRGLDYGEVIEITDSHTEVPRGQEGDGKETVVKNVLRKASSEDIRQIDDNKKKAKDAMRICVRKAREFNLSMKLVDAEYSFDNKKIIFYFTSEGRVGFRELVKDLAKVFKIRIEMRQIGVRDEAKIFGGVGPCGCGLCCVRFLKNFEPVSIKMAKAQKLPLSSGKISGICGRLMCCLFYEYKTYKEYSKGLPKEGQTIETPKGKGKVISVNVLKRLVHVQLSDETIEKIAYPPVEPSGEPNE
jgi:cell fate regulator YaaT (PSP1 superfamily)